MDDGTGYDSNDPKHPEYHSTHADIWDQREREREYRTGLTKYEVTFRGPNDPLGSRWRECFYAENYGDAERKALALLASQNDTMNQIVRIELW